jgi:hypothetical protein
LRTIEAVATKAVASGQWLVKARFYQPLATNHWSLMPQAATAACGIHGNLGDNGGSELP